MSEPKLIPLDKDASYYLNKITLLFGETGSGKSTIIQEALYLLHKHIPLAIVFAPTNGSNKLYTDRFPWYLIRERPPTEEELIAIYNRQEKVSHLYTIANDMTILRGLFFKVCNHEAKITMQLIEKRSDSLIAESKQLYEKNEASYEISNIKHARDKQLKKLYKAVIETNKTRLLEMKLTEQQTIAVKCLHLNPRLLLILDDCAASLKNLKSTEVFKKLFYQGRNDNISTIISLQGLNDIVPDLRRSAMMSIFTTAESANVAFSRASNGFGKSIIKDAQKIIPAVFKEEKGMPLKHQKLVYIRGQADPLRVTIADDYEDNKFKFCGKPFWDICPSINRRKASTNNQFIDFLIQSA
jgi:ABC-type lipoprotein export system ATPase subunit